MDQGESKVTVRRQNLRKGSMKLSARLIEEYRGEISGEEFMLATYGWVSVHDLLQLLAS